MQAEAPAEGQKDQAMDEWLRGLETEKETNVVEPYHSPVYTEPAPQELISQWQPAQESLEAPTASAEPASSQGLSTLAEAQEALNHGKLDAALTCYNRFIQDGDRLDDVVHDLRDALYRYPVDINIWQTLGDAYARNNQLQEALDAYTKAEELLR